MTKDVIHVLNIANFPPPELAIIPTMGSIYIKDFYISGHNFMYNPLYKNMHVFTWCELMRGTSGVNF